MAAWDTPAIFGWDAWVRERWQERNSAGLVLLNTIQEQAVWAGVIRESEAGLGILHPERLASAAMRAHRLLAEFAPDALQATSRLAWSEDAAAFSGWLREFEARCQREGLISPCRLALELSAMLRESGGARPPILLIGFDRLSQEPQGVLDAWGNWELLSLDSGSIEARFHLAVDETAELSACIGWLRQRSEAYPHARLMVVVPGLAERRGKLERALLAAGLDFEFSLGVPLGRVGLARSALMLLRWLSEPLVEAEVDWLLSSGFVAASAEEGFALVEAMRGARQRGQERPDWTLEQFSGYLGEDSAWSVRMLAALDGLRRGPARQSPIVWVTEAGKLLQMFAWPGYMPLSSSTFQARDRWEKVLADCGSLGFDGSLVGWPEFVAALVGAVGRTIFAAESRDAAVQVTEPLESAGLLADGIWFLGASEENWPGRGQPNALLPVSLQRQAGMPHSSSQADWALAEHATVRLLASAEEVIFSFAGVAEARPSRLVVQRLGAPKALLSEVELSGGPSTEVFEDFSQLPFALSTMPGGAGTLTRQSLCPFQAFGRARLGGEDWERAEAGLNARQRGQLLHAVLHRVWDGTRADGLASLEELCAVDELRDFVASHVRAAMHEEFSPWNIDALPNRFPARFLELEAERLTALVTEWLGYERLRQPFAVAGTEVKSEVKVAGLSLRLRLDRVDALPDGSRLVIDYKSGEVGPAAWSGERPDDVQLPLYAAYAIPERVEGLAFARVRPGDMAFYGRVRNAAGSLQAGLHPATSLMKNPLTEEQLQEWRVIIERLGEDFLAGCADVDPKDGLETCKNCGLHAVCRVYENRAIAAETEAEGEELDG
jgi:probable DNA repair protein